MQEKLVDRATAVLAKQKRFDWKCRGYYSSLHNIVMTNGTLHGAVDHNNPYYDKFAGNPYYSAPTQSLLQRWLREVHKLSVEVGNEYQLKSWNCYIVNQDNDSKPILTKDDEYFSTYEAALEEGLYEALNLLP